MLSLLPYLFLFNNTTVSNERWQRDVWGSETEKLIKENDTRYLNVQSERERERERWIEIQSMRDIERERKRERHKRW